MAVLAKPQNLYSAQTAGVLPQVRLDTGNAALVVLEARGGSGILTLETTLADLLRWDAAQYSTSPDGPILTGPLEFEDRTRVYIRGPISFLQVNGLVINGAMSLWSFATPFVQPSGGGGGNSSGSLDLSPVQEDLEAILRSLDAQAVRLTNGLEDVSDLNPLPMAGRVNQGDAGTDEWPVIAGGRTISVVSSNGPPTLSTSIYASGDMLGTLMPFPVARPGHAGGVLESIVVTDLSAQSAEIDFFFWTMPVTLAADNAAFAPTNGDLSSMIFRGHVKISAADYVAAGAGKSVACKDGIGKAIGLPLDGPGILYVGMVTRGTPTYGTTNSLRISLGILQD
jgi:hypothetical protein